MKIRALNDRVIVKPLEKESVSSIIIPESIKEPPQEGEVVAVGWGIMGSQGNIIPLDVVVGDRVLYEKRAGTPIKIDDIEHIILHQYDILGII